MIVTVETSEKLTLADVVEEGRRLSGLENLHLDEVGGRLENVLRQINDELQLGGQSLADARSLIGEFLSERGKLLEDCARNPQIAEEVVRTPIFATGMPRSGTTLLHMVLGADPNNRLPTWWEVRFPSPPPSTGVAIERRKQLADADIDGLKAVDKSLLQWHPYYDEGHSAAPETEHFGVIDFHFVRRTMSYWRVRAFIRDDLYESDEAFYDWHHKVLQHMQYGASTPRWAMKGTGDFGRLSGLKRQYPDAKVLWIHRDPQKVVPSLLAMAYNVATGVIGHDIDRKAFADGVLATQRAPLMQGLASEFRDHPDVRHILYADFAKDPAACLQDVYDDMGLEFTRETADAMRHWLAVNKGDRHGKFQYSLDDFGYSHDMVEELFGEYRAAFGIPFEAARN
jgi:hypothetical protein